MKTQNDVVLMSEQKRIRTGERVFREVEMFWAVVIVLVAMVVLFAESPVIGDSRNEARLAGMGRPAKASPVREVQARPVNTLIHLTSSESSE